MKKTVSPPTGPAREHSDPGHVRTAVTPEGIARALMDNLYYIQGRVPGTASRNDWYMALAFTVRDRILYRWMRTTETFMRGKDKSVSYLSAEFLIGPQLGSNLINLNLKQFPEVQFVKIYDANGQTQNPDGRSDSEPLCLSEVYTPPPKPVHQH